MCFYRTERVWHWAKQAGQYVLLAGAEHYGQVKVGVGSARGA
jgi:hypothetical protein